MCNLQKRLIRAAFWLPHASDVYERLKTNGTAIKIATERLLRINKRRIIRWNLYRDDNFHSRRQVLKCLWKSLRQENRSKLSFTARIITKYSLERFLSICGQKISKGFLKFYKLIIKPDTQSDHCLKFYKRA